MTGFLAAGWLWVLLAVAALVGIYVVLALRRGRYAARFTNVALLDSVAPKRPGWRRHVAFGLLMLALVSLTVAMARPARQVKVPRDRATVMMVIDVSLSMEATDVTPTRLKAAQAAAKQFTHLLPKQINLGLVSFAGSASVDVAPTTNRDSVNRAIDDLRLAQSTATGDAIIAALGALRSFRAQLPTGDGPPKPVPSRIVMLSDGARTVGRPVADAVQAAQKARVPVSTIAFGTPDGSIELEGQQQQVPVDTETMKEIAKGTGGSYHSAASEGELRSVYQDLGSQIGYTTEHREVTVWAVAVGLVLAFVATGLSLLWTNRLL
jgi:Ca-activated chloride channel homolog